MYYRRVPLHGLEAVYRDGVAVGFLRRADYAFSIDKSIGYGYIGHHDGQPVTAEYIKTGQYSIEHVDDVIPAHVHLRSPFDPENKRVKGIYTP